MRIASKPAPQVTLAFEQFLLRHGQAEMHRQQWLPGLVPTPAN